MKTILAFLLVGLIVIGASGCSKEMDSVSPLITLIGENPMNVQLGTIFTDPGATAIDDIDGDITSKIVATGSVDTQTEGEYYRYYNVEDAAGNKAAEVKRRVKVMIF